MQKREIQFVGHGTSSRSSLQGGDVSLARNPFATAVPFPQTDFNAAKYIDAAVWLNNSIGINNWCAANATFYFRYKTDATLFKLRYME